MNGAVVRPSIKVTAKRDIDFLESNKVGSPIIFRKDCGRKASQKVCCVPWQSSVSGKMLTEKSYKM